MSKLNRVLTAAVAVMLVVSALTYWNSVSRAERFERGQKFLPNLNPDEIATIEVQKGDETVTLKRQGEEYIVQEANGYLAKNEAVNRLLRDLLELGLEQEVGRGEGLAAELEIEPPGEATIEVALRNQADKVMVRLRIGKRFEDGSGNYVQRRDVDGEPIYLTSRGVFLDAGVDSFLEKELLDVPATRIVRIEGPDFVFARGEGESELELQEVPAGKKAKSLEANRVKNALSRLTYDKVFVADDEEVRDLRFSQVLQVELEDDSGYRVASATRGDRTFIRVSGFHNVQQIAIERDESDEELQEKAGVLSRADEISEFNAYHGSWVYEVASATAEKLALSKADLLEAAS